MAIVTEVDDDTLVKGLQRGAFRYIEQYVNPANGLIADTSREGSPCSIAVVGFALGCYPVAVENGWMARDRAAARTLATLRFFHESTQSEQPDATGFRGFYYHFLDMGSGRRVWNCELSLVDTTLLLAGMLTAACYFDAEGAEAEIRELADSLYRRVDWRWAQGGFGTVAQGWNPESGFFHYGWEGYNEATLVYVLGLGSPTHALAPTSFRGWTLTYQWENLLGYDVLYAGPLFTHLFSHAWIDFRGIRDAFMCQVGSDYFENTKAAVSVQREYCERNPHGCEGYGRDLWGITAGDGPGLLDLSVNGRHRRFFGYMSRGAPYGPDDGTIAPWAMLATLPFTPDAALSGTRHLLACYPQLGEGECLASGFNPTLTGDDGRGWLSEGYYGLDQGLLVMMLENARSGLIWKLLRGCSYIASGLRHAGFSGGWLSP